MRVACGTKRWPDLQRGIEVTQLLISYAAPATPPGIRIRPLWLLIPNLLAVVPLFLSFTNDDSLLEIVIRGMKQLTRFAYDIDSIGIGGLFAAIPTALWTIALMKNPHRPRWEILTAWAIAFCALLLLTFICGYCLTSRGAPTAYRVAVVVSLSILLVTVICAWSIHELRSEYPPALLTLTGIYNANMMLLLVISMARKGSLLSGPIIGAVVIILQIAGSAAMLARWRKAARES
jgi:hypothetical protein